MLRSLSVWGAVFMLAGCAAAPIQQMSDARQSLQAAHAADADVHAPGMLKRAETDLSHAELALARHAYGQAKDAAVKAKREAADARRLAVAVNRAEQAAGQADRLGLLDEAASQALNRVKTEAASVEDVEALRHRAQDIARRLEERVNRFYLDKARPMLKEARERHGAMNAAQRRQLKEAERAYQAHHGKSAYDGISVLLRSLDEPGTGPRRDAPAKQGRRTDDSDKGSGRSLSRRFDSGGAAPTRRAGYVTKRGRAAA